MQDLLIHYAPNAGKVILTAGFVGLAWYSIFKRQKPVIVGVRYWLVSLACWILTLTAYLSLPAAVLRSAETGVNLTALLVLLCARVLFAHEPAKKEAPPLLLLAAIFLVLLSGKSFPRLDAATPILVCAMMAVAVLQLALVLDSPSKETGKPRYPVFCFILVATAAALLFRAALLAENLIGDATHTSAAFEAGKSAMVLRFFTPGVLIAGYVMVFFDNHYRNLDAVQSRADTLQNLYEITLQCNQAMARIHDRKALTAKIAEICVEKAGFTLVWIGTPNNEAWLQFEAVAGPAQGYMDNLRISTDQDIAEGRGATGTALREERPVVYNQYDLFDPWHERRNRFGLRSGATIPFREYTGIGCLTFYSREHNFFTPERVALLTHLAENLGNALVAIEIRRLRAEALRNLRANRRILKFALDSASDASWDWDIQRGKVVFSRKWREMLGFTAAELPNEVSAWERLMPASSAAEMQNALEAYISGRSSAYHHEFRIRGKDGQEHWIRDTGIIVSRDAKGKPVRMVGTMKLIDGEILQQKLLVERERHFRLLAENATDFISRHEDNGNFSYASPAFERVLGYKQGAVNGKSIFTFVNPEDAERIGNIFRELKALPGEIKTEYQLLHRTGEPLWVEAVIKTVAEDTDDAAGFQITARDISEKRRSHQRLIDHDQFMTSIIASQINGLIVTDTTGKIMFANYAAEDILDAKFKTLAGQFITDESLGIWLNGNGEPGEPLAEMLRLAIEKRESIPETELAVQLNSGAFKWLFVSVSTFYSIDNVLQGAIINFIDVSARVEMSRELELVNERLQLAINSANIGIVDADLAARNAFLSEKLQRFLGLESQSGEYHLSVLMDLFHPEDLAPVLETGRQNLRNEAPFLAAEVRLKHRDGSWIWFSLRGRLMQSPGARKRRRFSGILVDITERKEQDLRIRELSRSVMSIAEKERAEISAELHDVAGQGLVLAHLNILNFLGESGQRSDETEEKLLKPIKSVLQTIREISRRLTPVHMREIGLRAALEDMILSATAIAGLKPHLNLAALDGFFPDDWDINCYRIIQEALTNTIKHAQAKTFSVVAESTEEGGLVIGISDDGVATEAGKSAAGIGTLIMQERMKILNGNLTSVRTPFGFDVYMEIPQQIPRVD